MRTETLPPETTQAAIPAPPSPARAFWLAFSENRGAVVAMGILIVIALAAIFAELVAPHSPTEQFRQFSKVPPFWMEGGSWRFLLGTDDLGRDILSRLIHGARVSLAIGVTVAVVSVLIGVVLGLVAAFQRGIIDTVIMRSMDLLIAIPGLVLAILIIAVIGPSLTNTIVAVTVVSLPRYVRLVRASALSELGREYVIAARVAGVGKLRLMFVTVLPNCLSPVIVQAALGLSEAILEAAALGFLGLGAQPPLAEWGAMVGDGREFMRSNPWIVTFPGLAILITVISINLMGDGLRDALDPKLRRT
ncbi:MAG: ABC transporter permease subunit [Proteobacteria bacterium]|nr:ABC transporter permease subunit [Pseudomonadota bacterium]